jgi:hypothetical protein
LRATGETVFTLGRIQPGPEAVVLV